MLIHDSLKVADRLLRVDTPAGPAWRRYNGDGYFEHDDGRPFDSTGPLPTGERRHYALDAAWDALPYLEAMALEAMAAMASFSGMIPEHLGPSTDPDAAPQIRQATGGAMPLARAHADFVKLIASRQLGYPMDRPRAEWERYEGRRREAGLGFFAAMLETKTLAAGTRFDFTIRWEDTGDWTGRDARVDVRSAPLG